MLKNKKIYKNGNKPIIISMVLIIGIIIMAVTSKAAIINIPDDYLTIQEGVDASSPYDTVLVAPGYYYENVILDNKEIVLCSHFMFEQNADYIYTTIIDGSNQPHPDTGSTILIKGTGEYTFTKVEGFTITGGTGTLFEWSPGFFDRQGGGIMLNNSAATIRCNYIHNNKAVNIAGAYSAGGGGIQSQLGDANVENNIIINNEGLYGGGISYNNCTGTIKNNIIAHNYGGQDYSGSGIQKNHGGATVIENNTIVYNISGLPGAGIRVFFASPIIRNNIIWFNEAPSDAQIYGYTTTQYCNVQDGGVTGTGNIDVDPKLTIDNCLFLRDDSPCIDAGDPSEIYYDIADSINPLLAKWPSYGGLRNDIGAYGGSGVIPFEPIGVFVDTTLGWAPLDLSFYAYTGSDIKTWHWDFGDENYSNLQSPVHQYISSGLYNATVQAITNTDDTLEQTIYEIAIIADTIHADTVYGEVGHSVEVIVRGNNTLPVNQIVIPFEYGGNLFLKYDSVSLVGCRTEYFETIRFMHIDAFNKRISLRLDSSSDGSRPDLPPGDGNLLKIYFTISASAVIGSSNIIELDGYLSGSVNYQPQYIGSRTTFVTPAINTNIIAIEHYCCRSIRGNIDDDSEDIIDVSDLVYYIDYQFRSGDEPPCFDEADLVVDGVLDVSDLVFMVDYQFRGGAEPGSCP